jgi:hypothetical protein
MFSKVKTLKPEVIVQKYNFAIPSSKMNVHCFYCPSFIFKIRFLNWKIVLEIYASFSRIMYFSR